MIDQRTTYFQFALPHPANALDADVNRLRSALSGIDNMLNWARQRLNSDDSVLGTMDGLVSAIRAIQSQLDLIGIAGHTTLSYDNQGRVTSMSEVSLDQQTTRTTTYLYSPDGTLGTTTVVVGERTYVTSYGYTNGRLTSMTTQEQS
jgi:hypothetical protein